MTLENKQGTTTSSAAVNQNLWLIPSSQRLVIWLEQLVLTEIASSATGAAQQNYPQALQSTERHVKVNFGLGFELCRSRSDSSAFGQDADH